MRPCTDDREQGRSSTRVAKDCLSYHWKQVKAAFSACFLPCGISLCLKRDKQSQSCLWQKRTASISRPWFMLFRGNEIHIAGQLHPVVPANFNIFRRRTKCYCRSRHGFDICFCPLFHYFYIRSLQPALTVYLRRLSALTFFFLG